MEAFLKRLGSGRIIVADGAMGTMLQAAGMPVGASPESWMLENPDPVINVHRAYVEAGAELILTCTFGGNRTRLERGGLAERVVEINQQAVEIARKAADDKAYVAGDIGPLGQFLEPLGKMSFEQAVEIFKEQTTALFEAGVDLLYIETMSDLNELRAAIEAAKQTSTEVPICATMSFENHERTNMGVRPEQAAQMMLSMGVDAFGANCGATLEMTEKVVAKMHASFLEASLVVKPNAGKPHMEGRGVVYDATPRDMAEYAQKFAAMGARIIGGCCGSTPAHIAAIAQAFK
ncbi:MAG: homocysteine S-methyltransferase family protein [Chloroflexota bacterium]